MKGVQCYELFGGIALKNHAFSFFFKLDVRLALDDIKNALPITMAKSISWRRHSLVIIRRSKI